MSNNGSRRTDSDWRDYQDDPQGEPKDDPLSELARLIEEDPFADFEYGRRNRAPQDDRAAPPEWHWDDRAAAEPAPRHEEPADPYAAAAAEEGAYWTDEQDAPADDFYDEPQQPADLARPDQDEPDPGQWQVGGQGDFRFDDLYAERHDGYEGERDPYAGFAAVDEDPEGAPHYDDSGHLPPLDEPAPKRRGKTAAFGALAVIALLIGAGVVGYQQLSPEATDGPPIMVAADTTPVKVKPDEPGGQQIPNQDKEVFDRANGIPPSGKTQERIVSREEPVEDVPLRDQTGAAASQMSPEDEPRRVRTVVVKPDGTILDEPDQPDPAPTRLAAADPQQPGPVMRYDPQPGAEETAAQDDAATAEVAPAAEETPAETAEDADTAAGATDENGVPVPPSRPEGAPRVAAPSQPAQPQRQPQQQAFVPPAATPEQRNGASQASSGQPLQLVPQSQQQAQPQRNTQVASASQRRDPSAPLPVTGQAQSQTQTARATPQSQPASPEPAAGGGFPSGGYVVQVSSTRSPEDAESTASRVKQQYSGILSGYQTGVQRADLGDRGIYYRVAVGPLSDSGSAASLCSRLKSQGLDCFVRRN